MGKPINVIKDFLLLVLFWTLMTGIGLALVITVETLLFGYLPWEVFE